MMKKILSLCLAVIMLLGMIAMGVSAEETDPTEPAFKEWKLVLNDGIDIKFVFEGLEAGTEYTVKMESEAGDVEVKATADTDGLVTATYPMLNPTMFDVEVTATLVELDLTRADVSIMEYCNNVLSSLGYSDELRAVVIDLLNYAAATELYVDNEAAAPVTSPFGRELTAEEETAIQTITANDYDYPSWAILANISAKIGVAYNVIENLVFYDARDNFFTESGLVNGGELDDAYKQTYAMIVPNSWSGSYFNEDNQNTLTAADFKVGDIVVVAATSKPNWMLLYVGDSQFLAWCNSSKGYKGTITMKNALNFLAGQGYNGVKPDGTTAVTLATGAVKSCYILRPSRVIPNAPVIAPEVSDIAFLGTPNTYYDVLTQLEATPNQDEFAVKFDSAMPILGQTIGYRFYVSGELDGATFYGKLADGEEKLLTLQENENGNYVDFAYLNPTDLSKAVTVWAVNAEGNPVSITKQFSGEGYAAWAMNGNDVKLNCLVSAMMLYSKGVNNYVAAGRDYNSTLINIEKCINFAAVQYRISLLQNMTQEELTDLTASTRGNINALVNWVYRQAGIDPTTFFTLDDTQNNENTNAANADHPLNHAKVAWGSLDELQVGDLIFCNISTVADSRFSKYSNFVYIGNETFIYGFRGRDGHYFITFDGFDNPDTTEVVETFFDIGTFSYKTLIRVSNMIGYTVSESE